MGSYDNTAHLSCTAAKQESWLLVGRKNGKIPMEGMLHLEAVVRPFHYALYTRCEVFPLFYIIFAVIANRVSNTQSK